MSKSVTLVGEREAKIVLTTDGYYAAACAVPGFPDKTFIDLEVDAILAKVRDFLVRKGV